MAEIYKRVAIGELQEKTSLEESDQIALEDAEGTKKDVYKRQLYVSGREIISAEITDTVVGAADGSLYERRRYEPRTILVGYQLIAKSNEEFCEAFNHLNGILNAEQAHISFNDELDKYYIGDVYKRQQKHLEKVEDLKRRGFTDPAMRNWTFEHDNGRNPQTEDVYKRQAF